MDTNSYRVFLTLAEEMNYHRAAEKLYISQQALSQQIKRMEESCGAELFERRPTLKLTNAGKDMQIFARQIVSAETEMQKHFADYSRKANSRLVVGINHQRLNSIMPGAWKRFYAAHPNISVMVLDNYFYRLLDDMRNNLVDMVVGQDLPPTNNVVVRELSREQVFFVVHESLMKRYYPWDWQTRLVAAEKNGCDIKEFIELPMILPIEGTSSYIPVKKLIQENNLIPFKVFESVNQQLLFNLACGGDGASIITPLGLYDHIIHYGSLPQGCHCMKLNGVEKHVMSLVMRSDIIQPQYNIDMADEICKEFERFMKTIDGLFAK